MSALDELQRSLSRAVRAGAAADPHRQEHAAPASADEAGGRARRGTRGLARLRPRRGWHVFVTILVAGGVTTGALAATGNLPIVQVGDREANPNYQVMTFPGMDTRATQEPTLLPLRVRDPAGGPPWALRTFPIGRGRLCAQAGQLYAGRFGVVTQVVDRVAAPTGSGPAPAKTVFQELAPSAAILGVRCGATRPGGQLVAANRLTTITNPDGTDLRCGNTPPTRGVALCPITSVKVVRWGFVGPRGTSATFVQPGGRRGPTHTIDPRTGGAYLFAEAVDPAPFRASQRFERAIRERVDRRFPRAAAPGDRASLRQRMRQLTAYTRAIAKASRQQRRRNWRAQQAEAVDATFAGSAARRVAGPGAKGGPLPGVAPIITTIPRVGPAKVSATFRGPQRAVEIRFAAPVALDARPGLYAISIRGPQRGACGEPHSSQAEYAKQVAAGEQIVVRVRPAYPVPGHRWATWCPGGRYDVRVRHIVRNANKPGLRSEQPVGTTSFRGR